MSNSPKYLGINAARQELARIGIELNERQMLRAAEIGADGRRKLPFFLCPIENRLKIERSTLLAIFSDRESAARMNARVLTESSRVANS